MAGHLLVHERVPIFFLPGIPSQMRELLIDKVIPRLALWPGENNAQQHVRQRVYRTFGLGEVEINNRLAQLEQREYLKIGYYPVKSEVHVSLTVQAPGPEASEHIYQEVCLEIETLLGPAIYGRDRESMAEIVGRMLLDRGWRLATAESCTGGLIASKVTKVPGSSDWYRGGVIAYSNELKETLLGVDHGLLEREGAVSEGVARAMAAATVQRQLGDIGVSVTGIAGPTGGTVEKPVGTVHIGLATINEVKDFSFLFRGNRRAIQERTAQTALDLVRQYLLDNKGEEK
jgi:nicotinamide-nucleotide amidase